MSRLRNSLQAKILILVIVLLGLGFGLSAVITIESGRRLLMDQMTERAKLLATTIHKSIRSNMLEGRPDIARSLIKELKRLEGVKALQVFRLDGSEAFTDLRTLEKVSSGRIQLDARVVKSIRQQASQLEKMDSLKNDPHFKEAITTGEIISWMGEISENGSKPVPVLTFLKPLENEPACQICHGSESKLRGVVRVSTDVSGIEAKTRELRNRQIGIAAATMFIVGFALLFFLRRTVVSRIEGLAAAAAQVGRGDFENVPTVGGGDEIGRLGQVFRDMASSLSAAYQDLQTKNAELESTLDELRESRQKVELLENLKGQLTKFVPESVQRMLEENPNADTLEKKDQDVTVLFLDIEGYAKMSASYPQEVVNSIIEKYFSAFFDIVKEFGGDINETAGDGLMIIFQDEEDPMAHTSNAIDAAIRIRARAQEFNENRPPGYPPAFANMGINSGVASVGANKFETPGGSSRWTFTASGPVTNNSARIGAMATEGRIFIGQETARRVGEKYALVDMGTHRLKNIPEPMAIYQVVPVGVVFPEGSFDPIDAMGDKG